MATAFPAPVPAIQVGTYFVGKYYQVLQQQPNFVHQFYTDTSTMIRVDGDTRETATAMVQIHSLIMSLNFTGIEIKTAHSLDSWNNGVLVMVSGSVETKDFNGRRNFVQTFFLAPQEKGYFVLNDMFLFIDDHQIHQHPAAILAHGNFEAKLNTSNPLPESGSDNMMGREIQTRDFVASEHVEENDTVDKYSIPEPPQQVSEADNIVEETPVEESTPSFPVTVPTTVQDPPPVPVEEPTGEPPKQTYASILRVAKGHSGPLVAPQASVYKNAAPVASEWPQAPHSATQQSYLASSMGPERSGAEAVEEIVTPEEEGDGRSVYVRNLPSAVLASDVEREFKNFGRIKPDGVVIRDRKDIGVCYAFIEFEDAPSVQNAVKASPIYFGGRQVHIEERRSNSSTARGGRGRGRGRGGYQTEAPRGRFGARTFGRGSGQDGSDRDYSNKPRGNGFHQRGLRQERGVLGNQFSWNGLNPSEASDS
ncbi:nuclear transport factor 2 (NTF2) family protein with RNA binding (RRM-RBD-RNP motifs) domain-containing protein [Tasmannia lanceolata]|uniref:nuclear transport factor 2 (NTF2) family protein with RNA binding (RRM-RBD-RNP motifs) domain-containing protein n=1 Tax=Tasmannia lanceolata TaxID=3420 RepID=UPI004062FBA6